MAHRGFAHALLDTDFGRRVISQLGRSPLSRRMLDRIARNHGGIYPSFADGWRVAGKASYAGHDHPDIVKIHLELSCELRPSDYAALYWLMQLARPLKVFDFGGNIGNLFYSYRRYLPSPDELAWTVYDIPKIIAQGRLLAAERGVEAALAFTESFDAVAAADVLLISGALHYWEGSVGSLFETLSARPNNVIINRTPMRSNGPSFITIQRKENYATPCIVRNTAELIAAFEALNYTLIDTWQAPELSIALPLFPDRSVPSFSGFYFRLRADSVAPA